MGCAKLSEHVIIDLGDDCLLDVTRGLLIKDELNIGLSLIELRILSLLATKVGKIVPHKVIVKQVWGDTGLFDPTTLYMSIYRIRKKIEDDPSSPKCLLTIKGRGYVFYRRVK